MPEDSQNSPLLKWKLYTTVLMLVAIFVALVFTLTLTQPSYCQAMDKTMHYQARLMYANGNNVSDGNYTVTFSMYTQSSGGGSFWSETHTLYAKNGYVNADLGSITALNTDFSGSDYYLGVKVGTDSEMTPRKRLGSSPWSVNTSDSQTLQGYSPGTGNNNLLMLNSSGEIDIGGTIKSSGGLNISSGSINLPSGSIETADLADDVVTADKLNVVAIGSAGKISGLTTTYLNDLDGSSLTGVVASDIADGAITNAKVNVAAAIVYSKLNLGASVQGSDLTSNIVINTSGDITTSGTLNITGAFQLNSTAISATAAELNVLDGYTGNANDLNVIAGSAAAGVTAIEFQYLNGVTSAIQTQFAGKLNLSGGTMAGNLGIGLSPTYKLDVLASNADVLSRALNVENQYIDAAGTVYGGYFAATGVGSDTNFGIYATASGATDNYAAYFDGNLYFSADKAIDGAGILEIESGGNMILRAMEGNSLSLNATNIDIGTDGDDDVTILDGVDAGSNQILTINKVVSGIASTADAVLINLTDVGSNFDALQVSRSGGGAGAYALNVSSGDSYFAGESEFVGESIFGNIVEMDSRLGINVTPDPAYRLDISQSAIDAARAVNLSSTSTAEVVSSLTTYGGYITTSNTGDTNGAGAVDKDVHGFYSIATNTGNVIAGTSTRNTYGGYFQASGSGDGTSTAYGIYAMVGGADTNWAGYFNGNVAVVNNLVVGGDVIQAGYKLTVSGDIYLDGDVRGTSSWSGRETGAWGNANPSTITVTVTDLTANDLVIITPVTEKLGDGDYWVTAGVGSFVVSSRNAAGVFQETMDFNWIVIKQ